MIARGHFSFYLPRLHPSSSVPSKSFGSPTCKISSRNSFISHTYAKTGVYPPKNVGAPTFSLYFLPISSSRPSCFSIICALFHFPYHTYPTHFPYVTHSSTKNRGYTPALAISTSHESPVTFRLPCPTSSFPLKWNHPFPVFTGENQ